MSFKKANSYFLCLFVVVISFVFLMSSCAKKAMVKDESVPEVKQEEVKKAEPEVKEEMPVEVEKEVDEEALREEILRKVAGSVQDVFFAFDKYNLSDMAKRKLESTASALKENSGVRVLIEGHCDERGTIEYNLVLGEKRANAAMDYLVNLGVSADRLNTISYGEEKPFDSVHSEIAWAKNRRAHFVLK